jgi:hypothetical protein
MKIFLIALFVISFAGSALGQDKIDRMNAVTTESFTPDTVKWSDEPILPNGAQSVVLVGDPNKAGVFIAWLKFPPQLSNSTPQTPIYGGNHSPARQIRKWRRRNIRHGKRRDA